MSVITAHITVGKKSRTELISAINPIFAVRPAAVQEIKV